MIRMPVMTVSLANELESKKVQTNGNPRAEGPSIRCL